VLKVRVCRPLKMLLFVTPQYACVAKRPSATGDSGVKRSRISWRAFYGQLCLFTDNAHQLFYAIRMKLLNSLTTIDTFSWLGGREVPLRTWVQEVPGSIPGSGKVPGSMHHSAKFQTPPNAVDLSWSCEGLWRGLSFVFSRSDCHLTI